MSELESLQDILEMSVEKNGEIPLTNRHLLNIIRMAMKSAQAEADDETISECQDILTEHFYK